MRAAVNWAMLAVALVQAASAQHWTRLVTRDPMTGKSQTLFALRGSYIEPPAHVGGGTRPTMVVHCDPGWHKVRDGGWSKDWTGGKFKTGYFDVGAEIGNVTTQGSFGPQASGSYRLDQNKEKSDVWDVSTSYNALFFNDVSFDTYLYGHFMPHKNWTKNSPTRRLLVAVNQYIGGRIVMSFDLSNSRAVADACGVVVYKKKPRSSARHASPKLKNKSPARAEP